MWKFVVAAATLVIVFLLFRSAILELLRGFVRISPSSPDLTPDELLGLARGRSIVVGEHHGDANARGLVNALLNAAHERGYRVLGVEASWHSVPEHSGLEEELTVLHGFGNGPISEHDPRSALDPDEHGHQQRMNRYWQMRVALRLGWRIVPIDPNHWSWQDQSPKGYFDDREPAMAECIRETRMIAVCGYGHLQGLHEILDDYVAYVRASRASKEDAGGNPMWEGRIAFAATVPILRFS